MAKLETKIEIQSAPKVKTLVELLDKYRDDLPTELIDSLNDLSDCDQFEYGVDDIHRMAIPCDWPIEDIKCFIDGELNQNVSGVNTILKRVSVTRNEVVASGDCFVIDKIYPKHFAIKAGDKVLIEFKQ